MDRPIAAHRWWAEDIEDGDRHRLVFDYVQAIERRQEDVQLQMYRNAYLYTGEELSGIQVDWQKRSTGQPDLPRINVVQSVVETAYSRIASREPRLAVVTRGGDWDLRQRAKGQEQYLSGKLHATKFPREWAKSFRDGASLGTGLCKWSRLHDDIACDRIFPANVIVDEAACRTTPPTQMFERRFPDVDQLCAEFPVHADDIWKGASSSTQSWVPSLNYDPYHVPVIESYRKRLSPDRPGLHLVCVKDKILFSEPWNYDWFPYLEFRWMEKLTGFYGMGIPELVFFLQGRVNRDEAFITACQNRAVSPCILVDSPDANLAESITNDLGQIIPWSGRQKPEFVTPPQVPPETYRNQERKINLIYQVSGMSEFATGGKSRPPTGLDSEPALAQWIEYSEGRFSMQEKHYDEGFAAAGEMVIALTKELAADGKMPKATWDAPRYGLVELNWSKVDMKRDMFRLRIMPASSTSETPAGLRQRLEEERASGRLADDLYRYFVQTMDVEAYYTLYDAAVTDLMRSIWLCEQEDKEFPAPGEYQALELGKWLFQMEWNKVHGLGAPDKVLRRLSTWIEQAEFLTAAGKGAQVGPTPQLGPGQVGGGAQAPGLQDLASLPVPGLS